MQFHPDRNPGNPAAEDKFKEATEAYGILIDGQKRARYDRYGHAGIANDTGGFDPSAFTDLNDVMGDFFSQVFGVNVGGGRRRRGSRAQKGEQARADLVLTFEKAPFRKQTQGKVHRFENTQLCNRPAPAPRTSPTPLTTSAH